MAENLSAYQHGAFKTVVVSGCRPTGALHLGNYFGAIKNWIELQNSGLYDKCYFFVADWHALTTDYESPKDLEANITQMVLDWLACGLNPEKSVIFRQSHVAEHAELALLLSMITPLGWLERNPTYKEQLRELSSREIQTHGFLGYPVLQAADILIYKATHVPVGEDQLSHLELSREIARRFNRLYKEDFFPEPKALLTPAAKVLGPDKRKMSKSYGNTIVLREEQASLRVKIMTMYTDPKKIHLRDHGHPQGCVVFSHHRLFSRHLEKRQTECRQGRIGCVACKKDLIKEMEGVVGIWREKAKALSAKGKSHVDQILSQGTRQARQMASETIKEVRQLLGLG